jgi:hypothetical protein
VGVQPGIAMFKRPGQLHGTVKICRLVKLDVHPDVF